MGATPFYKMVYFPMRGSSTSYSCEHGNGTHDEPFCTSRERCHAKTKALAEKALAEKKAADARAREMRADKKRALSISLTKKAATKKAADDEKEVKPWLTKIDFRYERYASLLIEEGFDSMRKVANLSKLPLSDLKDMGIKRGDACDIAQAAKQLEKQLELDDAEKALADDLIRVAFKAAPKSVLIKGATGRHASCINGVYRLTNLPLYNGRPLWQKDGDTDNWLRCTRSTKWMTSTSEDIEADNSAGRFLSVEKGLANPTAGKQWQAWNYTSKKWETQSQASVAAV